MIFISLKDIIRHIVIQLPSSLPSRVVKSVFCRSLGMYGNNKIHCMQNSPIKILLAIYANATPKDIPN